MRALQLQYTSCRRGLSGNAGFQTRALTPGIGPDEQREIERRGVYRPPRDANPEPAPEEIARDFPRALRCYVLESGRRALTRACYSGRDYSGRWGNFFSHTLVLDSGHQPSLWPIDYYEWDGWRERLPPEEDTEQPPAPLTAAELDGVTPAESFRLEELQDFLHEQPGRRDLLARMGRAVLLGQENSRAVVIRDSATNGLYWIACLQKLFPPAHSWALSCSTYQDDPRGCAAVNATTGETDFAFDDAERRFRFYAFDLSTGLHSEVPEAMDDYPATAARWLAESPDRLQRFFGFLRLFDHHRPEPELISALHLFELSEGQGSSLDGTRLAGMIAFAARHATSQGRIELLDLLGRAADGTGLARPEEHRELIRFLVDGAQATGLPAHRAYAFRAWLSLLRQQVVGHGRGLETAREMWAILEQRFSEHLPELAATVLEERLWRQPGWANQRLSPEVLAFLLRVLWRCITLNGRVPAWSQPEIQHVLNALATRPGDPVLLAQLALDATPRGPEALAAVSRLLAGAQSPETAGRALGRVLAPLSATQSAEIRRLLDRPEDWDVLFGEWLEARDRAPRPLAAFEEYRRTVLEALPSYANHCFPRVASSLLAVLPEAERISLSLSWLRSQEIDRLSPEVAGECLALANDAVPLDPDNRGGDGIARLVADSAVRLGLPLRPDRPRLREILAKASAPHSTFKQLRLDRVHAALADLRPDERTLFLSSFLPAALERADTREQHRKVLVAVCPTPPPRDLEEIYLNVLRARRKSPWPEPLQAALKFWLAFDAGEEELKPLAPLQAAAQKGLSAVLARLKPERLEEVRKNIERSRPDARALARWKEIEEDCERRRRGPWTRLVSVFTRKSPETRRT